MFLIKCPKFNIPPSNGLKYFCICPATSPFLTVFSTIFFHSFQVVHGFPQVFPSFSTVFPRFSTVFPGFPQVFRFSHDFPPIFPAPTSPRQTGPGRRQGHAGREAGHVLGGDLGQGLAAIIGWSTLSDLTIVIYDDNQLI